LRHEIEELRKDPAKKAEADKLVAGRSAHFPAEIKAGEWYRLRMEIVGEELRVFLDGKFVGLLKSSGIAHPTKSDFYFAVSGKDACFDEVRIWEAAKK